MTNIGDLFPSKYLKASDLAGHEVELTIKGITVEDVGDGDERPVVSFADTRKGIVLNRTNANSIAKQYGEETDAWLGKAITIYPAETEFKGETVACIRVRAGLVPKPAGEKPKL